MRRRDFITLLGGAAAAWPLAARAQQPMPAIGFLSSGTLGADKRLTAFRQGLARGGYIEGRNITIESRWAEDQYDRLPALAADLVQRRVAVIATAGAVNAPLAAKAATTTIPIVFVVGSDPIKSGLVTSLARPGGNMTGFTRLDTELLAKRLEILRELVPNATAIGLLVNPSNPNTEPSVRELQGMAQAAGWVLHVAAAAAEPDLDKAFVALAQARVDAFLNATDALFARSIPKMIALADHYRIPAIYLDLDAARNGGLMSYADDLIEDYRLAGGYVARILKGEKPADLPVQQPTKIELVINLRTAKALGITVPLSLVYRADEIIE
jgi:putative ABC transport system substrate-binding protein